MVAHTSYNKVYGVRDNEINTIGEFASGAWEFFIENKILCRDKYNFDKSVMEDVVKNLGSAMKELGLYDGHDEITGELKEFIAGGPPTGTPLGITDDGLTKPHGNFTEKKTENSFEIYFELEPDGSFPFSSTLHECWHVMRHWNEIKIAKEYNGHIKNRWYCKDAGFAHRDAQAFARAFVMPAARFFDVAKSAKKSDEYNIIPFAETFNIHNTHQIRLRGQELGIWR